MINKKTYKVAETSRGYILCDDDYNLITDGIEPFHVWKYFEVKEGQPFYAIDVFSIKLIREGIKGFEPDPYYYYGDSDSPLKNKRNRRLMDIVRKVLGDKRIKRLYQEHGENNWFRSVNEEYIAFGSCDYNRDIDDNYIYIQAEIKFRFWIEDGTIKFEPIWKFKEFDEIIYSLW